MARRPGKKQRLDPHRVRAEIDDRTQAAAAALSTQSAVPEATLCAADDGIAEELIDDVLHLVLNEFLQQPRAPTGTDAIPEPVDERIGSPEVGAFLGYLASLPPPVVPDFTCGLRAERFWILMDLACNGPGLSRQRASAELRKSMHDLCRTHEIAPDELSRLLQQLTSLPADGPGSALFAALRSCALRATTPGSSPR
jgi:hypothetical protein